MGIFWKYGRLLFLLVVLFSVDGFAPVVVAKSPLPEVRSPIIAKDDFESLFTPMYNPLDEPIGSLPPRWENRSGNTVSVVFGPLVDDAFEGDQAFRFQVKKTRGGVGLLLFGPVSVRRSQLLKCSLAVRSLSRSPFRFGLASSDFGKIYFEQEVMTNVDWNEGEVVVRATESDHDARFFVLLKQPGSVDLDELLITPYMPPKDGGAILEVGTASPNLLPGSSFPDGVHPPWSLVGADVSGTDVKMPGPTGVPALGLQGAGAVLSTMFQHDGVGDYTVSVYMKGSHEGQVVSVIVGPAKMDRFVFPYRQTLVLGEEWQRYTVSLALEEKDVIEKHVVLRLQSMAPDRLWMDGVQIEKSGEMGAFTRANPVEVALQSFGPYGINFEGEPLVARITVLGQVSLVAKVNARLFDVHGKRYDIPPMVVRSQKMVRRRLVIDPLGEPALGSYRLEVEALDKEGKTVSRISEMMLHRVRVPVDPKHARTSSPFGIIVNHLSLSGAELGVMRSLGFKWVRDRKHFSWRANELTEGKFDFTKSDRIATLYDRYKMRVCAVLGPPPRWAANLPEDFPIDVPILPRAEDQWRNACSTIAAHFSSKVHAWEPWPKPLGDRTIKRMEIIKDQAEEDEEDLSGGAGQINPIMATVEEYANMQMLAFSAIKNAVPDATVVGALDLRRGREHAGLSMQSNWFVESSDKIAWFDDLEFGRPVERLKDNSAWLEKNAKNNKGVWMNRANAFSYKAFSDLRFLSPEGDEKALLVDVSDMLLFYINGLSQGVERFFVPGFPDNPFKDVWRPSLRLFSVDGRLNPNATAFANLAWHLENKTFHEKTTLSDYVAVYTFAGNSATVAVLVSEGEKGLRFIELPEGVEVRDIFGNDLKLPFVVGRQPCYFYGVGFSPAKLNYAFTLMKFEKE